METQGEACTIIIATLALAQRRESLERAIASIRAGNACAPRVLVVVNGDRHDAALLQALRARDDVDLLQIPAPSLPAALQAGRLAVRTPFFGFLDDDDEYLPGAVDARLQALAAEPAAALVASNGFRRRGGLDRPAMARLTEVAADPLAALFRENWLASCGGLFRAELAPPELFEDISRHFEWTWLAFRLAAAGRHVVTLDVPTFRIHETAGSESRSEAYMLAQVAIHQRMLAHAARPDIVRALRGRLSQAWHDISAYHLRRGALGDAWSAHLHSLRHPSGFKFLSYTRRLLAPGVKIRVYPR